MIRLIFVIFVLSGFVGLMYEAIWSRYLKLLLGHSSAGQILTLAIFMGGLGLGSFLVGRFIRRIRRPLRAYAAVELVVGLMGWSYHALYNAMTGAYFTWVTGAELSLGAQMTAKILLCLLTTLPVAILLGMTFPLIAVGVMRQLGDAGARSLSMLYFTNSLGAAAGILVTSYFFIRTFGTSGTLVIAGAGNLLVAFAMLLVSLRLEKRPVREAPPTPAQTAPSGGIVASIPPMERVDVILWLSVACLTGFASFIYEVGWIRLVSLLLGSSTHSFDIMVSAFVLGLAFGGLYSRRLLRTPGSLALKLGVVQLLMGAFALATIFVPEPGAHFINTLHLVFDRTTEGYIWYSAVKYLFCLAFMFPAAFCAGITLPIITYALINGRRTEKFTGYVYGVNTIGSIVGAALAGYVLLPLLQLQWTIAFGALLDAALGLVLLWRYCPRPVYRGVATAAFAALVAIASLHRTDLFVLNMGVYRQHVTNFNREAIDRAREKIEFYSRDGRTATISLNKEPGFITISTNGKSDGATVTELGRSQGRRGDDATMVSIASIPMRTRTTPYDVAIIGMGTGITAHSILGDPLVRRLDLIEIEAEMLHLAKHFRPRNERAYSDERINFIVDDAKSYFYNNNRQYDLLISEPSNPWVSGVSSLFTREFYHHARHFVRPGGLLVQWLHVYEFEDSLLKSILSALDAEFADYLVFSLPENTDIVILASAEPLSTAQLGRVFTEQSILADYATQGWPEHYFSAANLIASKRSLTPVIRGHEHNSDFHPIVDEAAEAAFFRKSRVQFLTSYGIDFPALGRELDPRLVAAQRMPHAVTARQDRMGTITKEGEIALLETYAGNFAKPGIAERYEALFYRLYHPLIDHEEWLREPVVRAYRAAVEDPASGLPEGPRLRFRLLDACHSGDRAALIQLVPAALSSARESTSFWDRALVVAAFRSGHVETMELLVAWFCHPARANVAKEEKLLAFELLRTLKSAP